MSVIFFLVGGVQMVVAVVTGHASAINLAIFFMLAAIVMELVAIHHALHRGIVLQRPKEEQ